MEFRHVTFKSGDKQTVRRGMQVSRENHKGIAFINHTAPDSKRESKRATVVIYPWQSGTSTLTFANDGQQSKGPRSIQFPEAGAFRKRWEPDLEEEETWARRGTTDKIKSKQTACCAVNDSPTLLSDLIPSWALANFPASTTDRQKQLLCISLVENPLRKYPFERQGVLRYNPLRASEVFRWITANPVTVQLCTAVGGLYETMRKGQKSTTELRSMTRGLCFLLKDRYDSKSSDLEFHYSTMQCLITLATISLHLGEREAWHQHMRALRRLVKLHTTKQLGLPALVGACVLKTDMNGVLTFGAEPYMSFTTRNSQLAYVMSKERQAEIRCTMYACLSACEVSPTVIAIATSAALFSQNWDEAQKQGNLKMDPTSVMEEFYLIQMELLSRPMSLFDDGYQVGQSQWEAKTTPESFQHSLSCALRIAVILYMREQAFDRLGSMQGYFTLLSSLCSHLDFILGELQKQRKLEVCTIPFLIQRSNIMDTSRPVLLWICLVADALMRANMGQDKSTRYYASVLCEVVQELLGPDADTNFLTDQDLAMCRMLDVKLLRGNRWNDLAGFDRMLRQCEAASA